MRELVLMREGEREGGFWLLTEFLCEEDSGGDLRNVRTQGGDIREWGKGLHR